MSRRVRENEVDPALAPRAPRRPEVAQPLPPGWMPAAEVQERIQRYNLDVPKVLEFYRRAKTGAVLKRWRDDTFIRWFDLALLRGALNRATAVPGMPVVYRKPY